MRIGVQTWGSEGDIRPLAALACGLAAAGHDVTFAATSTENRDFSGICREHGVEYLRVPEEVRCDVAGLGRMIRESPGRGQALRRLAGEIYLRYLDDMSAAARRLCESSDLVVGHCAVVPLKLASLERGTPFVSVILFRGCVPSLHRPPGRLPDLGRVGNYLEWRLVQAVVDHYFREDVRRLWRRSGLRPPRHVLPDAWESDRLNLVAASTLFAPHQRDWGDRYRVCGYFHLPETEGEWQAPPQLREFLDAGEPPVYMTFGVLQPCFPEESMRLQLEAARIARCRAIVQTTLPGYPPHTRRDQIYFLDRAPHHLLFPRCAAIVHHGGSGTIHSATLRGRPSVVVGFSNEQMANGADLHRLGAACRPLRFRRATPQRLARRIREVLDAPRMAERADVLAGVMRGEDGVRRAVDAIGRLDLRRDAPPVSGS